MKRDDSDFAIDSVVVKFEASWDSADGLADPTGIDIWSYGFDDASGFVAILCRKDRCLEVLAVAKHDLGAVESESFNAETDLAWAGLRKWEFIKLKDFGGSGLVETDDLYGVGHAYPSTKDFSLR
jgi:hypothetical protein